MNKEIIKRHIVNGLILKELAKTRPLLASAIKKAQEKEKDKMINQAFRRRCPCEACKEYVNEHRNQAG